MFLYRGNTFVIYGFFVTNNIHMCMYIVTQVSRCLLINRVGCVLSNPVLLFYNIYNEMPFHLRKVLPLLSYSQSVIPQGIEVIARRQK
jgi:hypothetical protein